MVVDIVTSWQAAKLRRPMGCSIAALPIRSKPRATAAPPAGATGCLVARIAVLPSLLM